jgi:RNase P subunit RPR2
VHETERIVCPLCGWVRTIPYGANQQTGEIREVRFDKVDPAVAPMWMKARLTGAGRGSHNAKIEFTDSKGLKDLPEDMKDQIKRQCHKILEVLEE